MYNNVYTKQIRCTSISVDSHNGKFWCMAANYCTSHKLTRNMENKKYFVIFQEIGGRKRRMVIPASHVNHFHPTKSEYIGKKFVGQIFENGTYTLQYGIIHNVSRKCRINEF